MTPGKLRCPRVGLVILTVLLMLFIRRSELHGVQGCGVQTCGKQMTGQLEWAVLLSFPPPSTLADDQGRPATGALWDCWPPGTLTSGSMLPSPFWKGLDQVPLPGLVVWLPLSPAVMEQVVIGRRRHETLSPHPRIRWWCGSREGGTQVNQDTWCLCPEGGLPSCPFHSTQWAPACVPRSREHTSQGLSCFLEPQFPLCTVGA